MVAPVFEVRQASVADPFAVPVVQTGTPAVVSFTRQIVPVSDLVTLLEEGTQPAMTMLSPRLLG